VNESIDLGSLEPIQVHYTIDKKQYILKEASEATRANYQSLAAKGTTMQDGKVTVGTHLGQLNTFLVSQCLWECDEAGAAIKPVTESTIKNWLGRIVKTLADKAEEISGLKPQDSPERKALIAALNASTNVASPFPVSLTSFRGLVQHLLEQDQRLYSPLWHLVKPSEEEEAKNSR
jgi:hypothetical protein